MSGTYIHTVRVLPKFGQDYFTNILIWCHVWGLSMWHVLCAVSALVQPPARLLAAGAGSRAQRSPGGHDVSIAAQRWPLQLQLGKQRRDSPITVTCLKGLAWRSGDSGAALRLITLCSRGSVADSWSELLAQTIWAAGRARRRLWIVAAAASHLPRGEERCLCADVGRAPVRSSSGSPCM